MLRRIYRKFRVSVLHNLIPCSREEIFSNGRDGVEVVGFFKSASGIGESARLCARQLQDNGIKVRCTSVEKAFLKPEELAWAFENTCRQEEVGCRIIHLNPPMMPPAIFKTGLRNYMNVYNVAYWAWELDKIPMEWEKAFRYVNAVFCPSDFTSETIRKYTDKPVMTVHHPVRAGEFDPGMRERLGIGDDVFLVSSLFSFGSALERKNPASVIRSFASVFGGNEKACLTLKSNHGGDSKEKERLLADIASYPNIRLIDDLWEKEMVAGLLKTSDVFMSLHRSEGFGLPIAEALLLGTPVIVTNWSGNTDFCREENAFLVDADMVPVQSDFPEFASMTDAKWAAPEEKQAEEILSHIYKNRRAVKEKAQKSAAEAEKFFREPGYLNALTCLRQAVTGRL